MKRIISLLLILVFLPIPVKGAEEKYVALTFDLDFIIKGDCHADYSRNRECL